MLFFKCQRNIQIQQRTDKIRTKRHTVHMTCYFFWRAFAISHSVKHACLYRLERAQTIAAQQFPIWMERVCARSCFVCVCVRQIDGEQDRQCKVMCIALIMYWNSRSLILFGRTTSTRILIWIRARTLRSLSLSLALALILSRSLSAYDKKQILPHLYRAAFWRICGEFRKCCLCSCLMTRIDVCVWLSLGLTVYESPRMRRT